MKEIWKTCEICKGMFKTVRTTQRYCPTCGKNPAQARTRLELAEKMNRRKFGNGRSNLRKVLCKECGKAFLATYRKPYCSYLCSYTARVKETVCPICGKKLLDAGVESVQNIPCSPECKAVHEIRKAKKNGRYKTCLQCGKEFIAFKPEGKFCCRDCHLVYTKTHKNQKGRTRCDKEQMEEACQKTCRYCGGVYTLSDSWQSEVFCSPTCRDKAKPKVIRHIPPCKALEKSLPKSEPEQKEKVSASLHLCTTCRTSQSQCERFASQFVYFPKGAVVKQADGKPIVVSCPKFSAAATKKKK